MKQFSPIWDTSQYRAWPNACVSPKLDGTRHRNEGERKEGRGMEGLSSRNNHSVFSIAIMKILKSLLTKKRSLFTSQNWMLQGQGCTAPLPLPLARAPLVSDVMAETRKGNHLHVSRTGYTARRDARNQGKAGLTLS